jgi:ABC-type branched-subunit amino acid transport system substrate-binding protein
MKRLVVIAVAALLMTAACGSTVSPARRAAAAASGGDLGANTGTGDTVAGSDTGGGTQSSGATGSAIGAGGGTLNGARGAGSAGAGTAAGSKATTGPIELGFVRTGVSNAAAFGVSLGNTVTETDVDNAVVAAYNDQGGIDGRKITPVYADTDTASSSWDADFEAACAKLTQDNHVVAVLGYVFNHDPSFESCLAKKGIPHLSTTFNVPDTQELANYPLLVALSTPRIERRSIEKVDGALATGVLTKANKLGIVIDSCPGTERAWTQSTKPYILSKGLTITSTFQIGCAHGSGDAASEAGQAGNLVLQFRTAGVDRILIPAVSEGPAVLIIANAAEAQGWHPWYIVSSLANGAVLGGQIPADQAANVHGYGWLPMQDVNPAQWPGRTAAQDRCVAMLKQKGITLQSATDFSFAFNICDSLFLYEIALKATGGRTDGQAIVGAIEALGSTYVSAMVLQGRTTFGRTRHDAPSLARYFAWDGGCSCFTYRPTTFTIS